MAEAQAHFDVATAFDLEDSDEGAKSKMDEPWSAKLVEMPTEASLERNEQTQPMDMIVAVPEVDGGGRGGRGRTVNRAQKPCFCCELMAVMGDRCCEMHERNRDAVFRQLKHQDELELEWVKKMEKERMMDNQEQWNQLLLNIEALSFSFEGAGVPPEISTLSLWLMSGYR